MLWVFEQLDAMQRVLNAMQRVLSLGGAVLPLRWLTLSPTDVTTYRSQF